MNCPNCSRINVNGAQFCGNCGAILPQQASTPQAGSFQQPQPSQSPPNAVPPTPQDSTAQPPAPRNNQFTAPPRPNPGPTAHQQNFLPGGGQPNQYPATPPQQYAPPQNSLGSDFTIKLKLKYLAVIAAVFAVSGLVYALYILQFKSLAELPLFVATYIIFYLLPVTTYAYISVSKIKQNPQLAGLESEKLKAIVVMTLSPVITLALYYFRLRKVNPQVAEAYSNLGWKILGIVVIASSLISTLIPILVMLATLGLRQLNQ